MEKYLECFSLNQMLYSVGTFKKKSFQRLKLWVERNKIAHAFSRVRMTCRKTDFPFNTQSLYHFKLTWDVHIMVHRIA